MLYTYIQNIEKIKKDKGIALVIALTTMTLLLSISLSISNIVLRQIKISGVHNRSKNAFFSADSAVECAFHFDTKSIVDASDDTININSDIATAVFGSKADIDEVECGNAVVMQGVKATNSGTVVTNFDIDYGETCAKVTVTKKEAETTIAARGYNVSFIENTGCDLSDVSAKRVVERGLTFKY